MKETIEKIKHSEIMLKILAVLFRDKRVWANSLKKEILEDHVTISRYLQKLSDWKIIKSDKVGKTILYEFNEDLPVNVKKDLNELKKYGDKILRADKSKELTILDKFKSYFVDLEEIYDRINKLQDGKYTLEEMSRDTKLPKKTILDYIGFRVDYVDIDKDFTGITINKLGKKYTLTWDFVLD